MKHYNYILLDWDGNIARTLDIWLAALRSSLEKRGHLFADEEIGASFTVFKERMEVLGIEAVDAMIAEADEVSAREIPNVELYPEALTTLEALHKAGKKIALVTTSRHEQIDPLLQKYRIRAFFDHVVCGDDVSSHKPNPEAIRKAIELLGGVNKESVMIGDSASDIAAANNAGIDSILFFPVEHAKFYDIEKLKQLQPTYVVNNFYDITRIAL